MAYAQAKSLNNIQSSNSTESAIWSFWQCRDSESFFNRSKNATKTSNMFYWIGLWFMIAWKGDLRPAPSRLPVLPSCNLREWLQLESWQRLKLYWGTRWKYQPRTSLPIPGCGQRSPWHKEASTEKENEITFCVATWWDNKPRCAAKDIPVYPVHYTILPS